MSNPTIPRLTVDQLHPHPDNPRLTLRDEVIDGTAAQRGQAIQPAPVCSMPSLP